MIQIVKLSLSTFLVYKLLSYSDFKVESELDIIEDTYPLLTLLLSGQGPGSRAVYTCDPDHELIGPEERLCQAPGARWTGADPYCKLQGIHLHIIKNNPVKINALVFCGPAPIVDQGSHNGPLDAPRFPVETVLKFTCFPGKSNLVSKSLFRDTF